jgi:hypothetical protein
MREILAAGGAVGDGMARSARLPARIPARAGSEPVLSGPSVLAHSRPRMMRARNSRQRRDVAEVSGRVGCALPGQGKRQCWGTGTTREGARMRGDNVQVVIDAGDGSRTYNITATKAGRRVEVTHGRGLIEVAEVTRGGTPVRTARFMASRVLAVVEQPASDRASADDPAVTPLQRLA